MDNFVEQIQRVLSQQIALKAPEVQGELYPVDQPPSLMVYFGPAKDVEIMRIRAQLPTISVLFWLCEPMADATVVDELSQRALERVERTVAVGARGAFEEKLTMVISLLPQRDVRLVIHQSFQQAFPDVCSRLAACIKRTLGNLSMESGRGLIFLRASLLNLGRMASCFVEKLPLIDAHTDAVVCAAGPSLQNQLETLRSIQDRVLLVAVGHAFPTLVAAGIRPHIVVEDDAVAGINWPETLDVGNTLLVAASTVDRRVSDRFERILWCQGSSPVFNQMLEKAGCPLANMTLFRTISTHAIEVAVRMGCCRIAMVGQDLSLGDSGLLHADGKRCVSDAERLEEVPANEGGTVWSTKDLSVLRESVEEYLALLQRVLTNASRKPRIINCTEGGALVRGAERLSLDEFCRDLKQNAVEFDVAVSSRDRIRLLAEQVRNEASAYQEATGAVAECARYMLRELERYPVDMERVAKRQLELQQAVAAEKSWLDKHADVAWISMLMQQADRISREIPGMITQEEDAKRQLYFLSTHYQMLRDVSAEIVADVVSVLDGSRAGRSPEVFDCFYALGVRSLRQQNHCFADWLDGWRKAGGVDAGERFRFRWKNQMTAPMEVRASRGEDYVSVAGEWSMLEQVSKEIDVFVEQSGLDANTDALVVVAPCNWVHVLELTARYRTLRLLVVEPWPEALAVQLLHGCFVHRLPTGTLVVGADRRVRKWKKVFNERIQQWKQSGYRIHWFSPAAVSEWNEIVALKAALNEMV